MPSGQMCCMTQENVWVVSDPGGRVFRKKEIQNTQLKLNFRFTKNDAIQYKYGPNIA